MRKSKIYKIDKYELLNVINNSDTIKQVFNSLEINDVGGNRGTLYKILSEYGFDEALVKLRIRSKESRKNKLRKESLFKEIPFEKVFCEHSQLDRKNTKNKILKYNLIEYKCSKCENKGEWQGNKLSLHLEHKNGIRDDNRLENLEFLCPNCHSQTPTYAGKNNGI